MPIPAPTPAARSLIAAIGGPTNLQAAPKAIQLAEHALEHARRHGVVVAADWLAVVAEFSRFVAAVYADPSLDETTGRDLAAAVPTDNKVYEIFGQWRRPLIERPHHSLAMAALGRALIAAVSAGTHIPLKLVESVRLLTRSENGRASPSWSALAEQFPADAASARHLANNLTGPPAVFARHLQEVYEATLNPPPEDPSERQTGSLSNPTEPRASGPSASSTSTAQDRRSEEADDKHGPPLTLKAKLAAAHYECFGAKLGLPHQWQRLPAKALASLTRQLALGFAPDSSAHAFSLLAITSLVAATPARAALELPFAPTVGADLHLDLAAGQLLWSYDAFCTASSSAASRLQDQEPAPEQHEAAGRWFPVPLPATLAHALRRQRSFRPLARDLGTLLGVLPSDLDDYGKHLRKLGDPAFPPYSARFSRSIGLAYLEVLGSDLAAASLGLYFAAAAPSALRYFGPTRQWIEASATQVYQYLGLGNAESMAAPDEHVGSPRVLPRERLATGWSRLGEELNRRAQALFRATDPETVLRLAGEANAALAAAFVVATAHRGSQLQRLTWRALLSHPKCMSIADKDGESLPRVVPPTHIAGDILALLSRVAHRVGEAAASLGHRGPLLLAHAPAFVTFEVAVVKDDSPHIQVLPIETAAVAVQVAAYFGGKVNAARHAWITHLGMMSVDRWLIRALAGHGTETTQPFGAATDVPILWAMDDLRKAMDRSFGQLFGDAKIDLHPEAALAEFSHGLLVRTGLDRAAKPASGVFSPHALLRPPTPDVIADAAIVDEMRLHLVRGTAGLSQTASLALHLMLFDPLPAVEHALDVAVDPIRHLRSIHGTWGAQVTRSHFVHDTWVPLSPPTLCAVAQLPPATAATVSRAKLLQQILDWILMLRPAHSPPRRVSETDILERLLDSWRRLNMPPSLHAIMHPDAMPPVLSMRSLHRFAAWARGGWVPPPPQPLRSRQADRRRDRHADLKQITATLGRYASTTDQLGANPRRAAKAIDELRNASAEFSPLAQSIAAVYIAELQDSVNGRTNSLEVSSLATYNSWLMRGFDVLDQSEDLSEIDDDAWQRFCDLVRQNARQPEDGAAIASTGAGSALASFFRRLRSVYPEITTDLSGLIGEAGPAAPRDSASAVLLLPADLEALKAEIDASYAEEPIDRAMLHVQLQLMHSAAARTGETGALGADALTADRCLVFEDGGYSAAKSASAIRLIELDEATSSSIAALGRTCREIRSPHLFRVETEGLRISSYEQQTSFLLGALKRVADDPRASRHSARAHALQKNTWPGWQACAATLFTDQASSAECERWALDRFDARHRTTAARQASAAGHAGLQASHGYYLSAWPLVAAAFLRGALSTSPPAPAVVERLGLNRGALRQARSRARANGRDIDQWQWLVQRIKFPLLENVQQDLAAAPAEPAAARQPGPAAVSPSMPTAPSQTIDTAAAPRYVLQRALGIEMDIAVARAGLPRSHAMALEPWLPSATEVLEARQRIKGDVGGRALAADRQRANSNQAARIMDWLLSLSSDDRHLLHLLANDDRLTLQRQASIFREPSYWKRITAQMPPAQALRVRFGRRHLLAEQQAELETLSPAIVILRDRDRGPVPGVLLTSRGAHDPVACARDTALLRLTALAIEVACRHRAPRTA